MLRRDFSDIEDKCVFVCRVFDTFYTYIFYDCKRTIKEAMDYAAAVMLMLYFAKQLQYLCGVWRKNEPAISVKLYIAEDCKVVGAKTDYSISREFTMHNRHCRTRKNKRYFDIKTYNYSYVLMRLWSCVLNAALRGLAGDEGDGLGGDAFFAAGEAEAFGGGGFDGDAADVEAEVGGDVGAHLLDIG